MKKSLSLLSVLLVSGFVVSFFHGIASATAWDVYTVSDLNTAVQQANSGDEIVVHPGMYILTVTLNFNTKNVTLRGSTGNYDDVIMEGGGMNTQGAVNNGISISTDSITIMHITLKDFYITMPAISVPKTMPITRSYPMLKHGTSLTDNILAIESLHLIFTGEPKCLSGKKL